LALQIPASRIVKKCNAPADGSGSGFRSRDPGQVERYGALIQREGGRLNNMVEQILQFASTEAGRVIQEREPLSMESVIEEAVAASRSLVEGSQCVVEKIVAVGLPPVLGDRVALRHTLENLRRV
jgi:signal transduction histidine kinase